MSARILTIDADGHQAVQTLLPWYATDRLETAERAAVDSHLAGCAQCRAELAWERRLIAAQEPTGGDTMGDPAAAWARLREQIDTEQAVEPVPAARQRSRGFDWRGLAPWLRWVLAAQFAAVLLLAMLVLRPFAPTESYHAMGAAASARHGNVIVRFSPGATEAEIRQALQAVGARLVDGPTATDAYLLEVPAERQAVALAALRSRRFVLLAESLEARPPR